MKRRIRVYAELNEFKKERSARGQETPVVLETKQTGSYIPSLEEGGVLETDPSPQGLYEKGQKYTLHHRGIVHVLPSLREGGVLETHPVPPVLWATGFEVEAVSK